MLDRDEQELGNPRARLAGGVYLLYFLTAIGATVFSSRGLDTVGTFVNVVAYAFYGLLTVLFYVLFRPVNRRLSLAAALVSFGGCLVGVLELFPRVPLHISPLIFFGPYCLLIGYLTLASTFLPRILGALMMLAGVAWLAFLIPPVAQHFTTVIEGLGVGAEGLFMLWLLAMGVNVSKWRQQAS
jgi:hypothetical protein